ncbi:MAG TPA: YceI family protein [Caulobacteraceae bacterium]
MAQAAQVFDLDPARSSITFTISLLGVSHRHGRFADVAGTLARTAGRPQDDVVMVEVRTDSVECGSPGCAKVVTGPRFFDSPHFPIVRFQSRKITPAGDTTEVTGDLTLHGVTRPIVLTAQQRSPDTATAGDEPYAFTASTTVRRSDFNMSNYRLAVGDTVTLNIRATFVPRTMK